MDAHRDKRRDMARSILPSKNRRPARAELARVKRANRRAVAQELAVVAGRPGTGRRSSDDDIDAWDERTDVRRYPDAAIRQEVRWRRDGDKLNHFIRWAVATTADLPAEDRLTHLRASLPDGLIGDHALTHLAREPALRPSQVQDWDRWAWWQARRDAPARRTRELDELRALLHEVLRSGGHADLNRVLTTCDTHDGRVRCRSVGCVRRSLAGPHDVDAFVADLAALDGSGPWRPLTPPAQLPVRRLRTYLVMLASSVERGA